MIVKLYLDQRRIKKDGTANLKFSIYYYSKRLYIASGVSLLPSNYSESVIVTNREPNAIAKRLIVRKKLSIIDNLLYSLELDGKLKDYEGWQLRDKIKIALGDKEEKPKERIKEKTFLDYLKDFTKLKQKEKTKEVYLLTKGKVNEFAPKIKLDEIDYNWLLSFDKWMKGKGLGDNTRGLHFRNLRAVYNYCRKEKITTNYPFDRFKIPKKETAKRSLSIKELRLLLSYEVEEHQKKYRDMFILSFLLVGINPIDLYSLTKENIKGDRIEYYREKTGKLYSIKLEEEAIALINKYKGEKLLLNIGEKWNYKNFIHRQAIELKKIGSFERKGLGGKKIFTALFPYLSIYWARHTWATLASELDIPDDTISQGLGHSPTNRTTDIYIKRNRSKVDKANRKVIDYLFMKGEFAEKGKGKV